MKKHFSITRALAFCMILIITFVLTQMSNAVNAPAPGSTGDPLITKSYVDAKVKTLSDKISALTSALDKAEASLAAASSNIKTLKSQVSTLIANNSSSGKYLTVKMGKSIILKVGAQVVLYEGSAKVNGILTDLTDGKAISTNQTVKPRHLIVSAVTDTRGIKASTDIKVLISGNYTIK